MLQKAMRIYRNPDHVRDLVIPYLKSHLKTDSNESKDLMLQCQNGETFHVHGLLFSLCSQFLQSLMSDAQGDDTILIILPEVKLVDLVDFIRHMYDWDEESSAIVPELFIDLFQLDRSNSIAILKEETFIGGLKNDVRSTPSPEMTITDPKTFSDSENVKQHEEERELIQSRSFQSYSVEIEEDDQSESVEGTKSDDNPPVSLPYYRCRGCSRRFQVLGFLISHMKRQHPDLPLPAPEPLQDIRVSRRKRGAPKHHLQCPHCEKTFTLGHSLKKHVESVHEQLRPYQCQHCGKSFKQQGTLSSHITIEHDLGNNRPYKCDLCDKTFKVKYEVPKHKALVHERSLVHVCEKCGVEFSCKSAMRLHIRRQHDGAERKYVCHICSQRFFNQYTLDQHLNRHNGVKPFKCQFCDMSFVTPNSRKRHTMEVHQKVRKHGCSFCGKEFARSSHLKDHMKSHQKASV